MQRKIHVPMRREPTESFSAVLYLFTLLGVSLFSIWEPHCGAETWCVERERNNSFEVAIRTSFFDDDAESLGKKRLVVDDETESDLRLSGRSDTLLVTQNKSFLADPFRNTHDLRLSCRSKCVCTLHATTEVFAMGVEIRGTVDVQNRSRTEPCGCRSCRLHHDLRPHTAERFRMSNFSV